MIRYQTFLLITLSACSAAQSDLTTNSHPPEFVGRWVLQGRDRTWADTLEFRPDGAVVGVGKSFPANSSWLHRRSPIRVQWT
jgi:hypothetical protein